MAAATFAVVATMVLSACTFGFNAQTNKVYQAGVGANHRGEIDVLNTLLVVNDDKSATLSAALVNNTDSDQSLSSVTVTTLDDEELPVRSTKLLLPLPQGVLTNVGGASDAGGFRVTRGVTPGDYVKVTLSFTDAADVTIEAPAVARTAEYDKVAGDEPLATEPTDEPTDDAE
jgi:copper(I)-binding protein